MKFPSAIFLAIAVLRIDLAIAIGKVKPPFMVIGSDFTDPEDDALRSTQSPSPKMIFPGTKWCGPGNVADNDNDLGYLEEVDKCCYAHDHCDAIASGETKYGLTNDSPYTKLHCSCDKAFYKCLKQDGGFSADTIGQMYSIGNEKCYKNAHPIVECHRYENYFFMKRCVEYIVDASQPKLYQYFDLPFYNDSDDFLNRKGLRKCMEASNENEIKRNRV